MPEETSPPTIPPTSLPPTSGATGEEILKHTLPLLVEAVTRSAEGHMTSAAAIRALETQIVELKVIVGRIAAAEERQAAEQERETRRRTERGEWLRSLLKPETIYYTLVIILTALGFRLTTLPARSAFPAELLPVQVEQPVDQELP